MRPSPPMPLPATPNPRFLLDLTQGRLVRLQKPGLVVKFWVNRNRLKTKTSTSCCWEGQRNPVFLLIRSFSSHSLPSSLSYQSYLFNYIFTFTSKNDNAYERCHATGELVTLFCSLPEKFRIPKTSVLPSVQYMFYFFFFMRPSS